MTDIESRSLTEAEYALAFAAFRAAMNQDQHTMLVNWFARRFLRDNDLHGRDIHYGSFGVATGALDARLISILAQSPDLCLRSVTLSEPNEQHYEALQRTIADLANMFPAVDFHTTRSTVEDFRSPSSVSKFNLVVGSQIFYYFADRKAALQKLLGLVDTGGRLLIAHQTPIGINAIHRQLLKEFGGPIERMFHMEQIVSLVREQNLLHVREVLWADLDVSSTLDLENEAGQWLLSFFIYLNVRRLKPEQIKVLRHMVESNSYEDGDKRLFPQPVGVLTVTVE